MCAICEIILFFFFFKQKTAYVMRISDWSSDVCSSDLLAEAVARRRTFAIISHPDAGKTAHTEKLLLVGGAIQLAGAVKARGEQRRAHSDWMKVERERGISVASSVMTYDYAGKT